MGLPAIAELAEGRSIGCVVIGNAHGVGHSIVLSALLIWRGTAWLALGIPLRVRLVPEGLGNLEHFVMGGQHLLELVLGFDLVAAGEERNEGLCAFEGLLLLHSLLGQHLAELMPAHQRLQLSWVDCVSQHVVNLAVHVDLPHCRPPVLRFSLGPRPCQSRRVNLYGLNGDRSWLRSLRSRCRSAGRMVHAQSNLAHGSRLSRNHEWPWSSSLLLGSLPVPCVQWLVLRSCWVRAGVVLRLHVTRPVLPENTVLQIFLLIRRKGDCFKAASRILIRRRLTFEVLLSEVV